VDCTRTGISYKTCAVLTLTSSLHFFSTAVLKHWNCKCKCKCICIYGCVCISY